ncbi:MAG: hypothetical protein OER92_00580 [Alphaproteobacteria bacterium]|nr:hypothetical protein [Alphaproteobacteria bacterium]
MQPLKILALFIGTVPIAAFLLTLFLTEGAPLRPLTPGEEGEPVAATRALPPAAQSRPQLERPGRVSAAGHPSNAGAKLTGAGEIQLESTVLVNHDRDALLFMTLFGVPDPYVPPSP